MTAVIAKGISRLRLMMRLNGNMIPFENMSPETMWVIPISRKNMSATFLMFSAVFMHPDKGLS